MFADQITIAAPLGYIELDGEINPGVPTLFGGSIDVEGSCRVVGRINSETNYPGTGSGWNSIDGVWIQENSATVANRWKMTYNATSRVLSLSRGTVRHTSPAFSVA